MFQGWRWKLRAAEEAFAQGRLREASQLLQQESLLEFLPGKRLSERVAQRMAELARSLMLQGDSSAAWRELEAARQLTGDTEKLLAFRQELMEVAQHEAESSLEAGNIAVAVANVKQMERYGAPAELVRDLQNTVRHVESARGLATRGKFTEAAEQLATVLTLRPGMKALDAERATYLERAQKVRQLTEQLHRAMSAEQWSEAVGLADELLAIAPQMPLAHEVRRRAWASVGARVGDHRPFEFTQGCGSDEQPTFKMPVEPEQHGRAPRGFENRSSEKTNSRFLLWVDAVGGFLVCLEPEVILGQAVPGNRVDVPILGDLSRQHARISRQSEGYVIEPIGDVKINGRAVHRAQALRADDEIQLGEVVRLRFRQPHALSATARLDFVSRHRTQPSADAILLLAESCVLGPRKSNHVLCRDFSQDVIVFRKDDRLFCRAMDALEVDGRICDGRGELTLQSRIVGEDFSLSLEPL